MTYYDVDNRYSYELVPLTHVLLQKKIIEAIKNKGGGEILKTYSFRRDPTSEPTAPLNRLDSMLEAFDTGVKLPPIDVNVRDVKGTPYYSVVNGRHRFAAAILDTHLFIPVKIVSTF